MYELRPTEAIIIPQNFPLDLLKSFKPESEIVCSDMVLP